MITPRVDGLAIASLRRRLLATLIDLGLTLSMAAALGAAAVKLYPFYRRRRSPGRAPGASERDLLAKRGLDLASRHRRAIWAFSLIASVRTRNWRGPGARMLRIRRVGGSDGGPVGVRSALTRFAFEESWKALSRRLHQPAEDRSQQRIGALEPELRRLQEEYAGDSDARQRATMDFYEANNVNPLSSCGRQLPMIFAAQATALWSKRNQSLADRLAGTVVIVETGNRPTSPR